MAYVLVGSYTVSLFRRRMTAEGDAVQKNGKEREEVAMANFKAVLCYWVGVNHTVSP